MPLRRVLRPRRAEACYEQALCDVLGAPGSRPVDALALVWGHEMAWTAVAASRLDEGKLLSQAAARYHVPLSGVLDERSQQQAAPPVVPANRPRSALEPRLPRPLDRPA